LFVILWIWIHGALSSQQQGLMTERMPNDIPDEERGILKRNPCEKTICGAGKECHVTESGEAKCRCVKDCGHQLDPRRMVCTNHNETFNSDCELHRLRCFCQEGNMEMCGGAGSSKMEKYQHVHVEYYGECRRIPSCDDDELAEFPKRMREWLFNVMEELADRKELSAYYQQMKTQAEDDLAKRWSNAAIWKWCVLDNDQDTSVSRHELFPVKAPLQALEHCIGDFLDKCDEDSDLKITLEEWGKCLMIPHEEIEMRCEKIA